VVSRFTPATRAVLRGTALAAAAALVAVGAAGCAGGDEGSGAATTPAVTASTAQTTASAGPYAQGDRVVATARTPRPVAAALTAHRAVVASFVLRGVADDDAVAAAVREVRSAGPTSRGVTYVTYDVASGRGYGDLVDLLGVTGTPTVVVIGRDGRVVNAWRTLADAEMLRQSVNEALGAPPG
jgi:hypothetical protein